MEPDHYRDEREPDECNPREDHDHDHRREPELLGYPDPSRDFHFPFNPEPWVRPGGLPDIELYDLIDFTMQVGNTGINFVAGLTGWRESDGTARFIPGAQEAAYRRAASTLAWMSLISGATFQFLRLALNLSVDQAAVLCGETPSTITDWEDGTLPVPVSPWQTMADAALKADSRAGITVTPLPAPNFRPRLIRIYPDIPYPVVVPPPACPCEPC
jgi:DNA-binding transcriptional regulator YiaG